MEDHSDELVATSSIGPEHDLDDVVILLVEDDARAAKWIRLALEQRGAKILWATRVDQARRLIERHEAELAILDVTLPDGNGLDLVVELRLQDQACACVVLTGNPESGVARIAAGLGVIEFLAKPVELDRLARAVSQARERTAGLRRILADHKGEAVQHNVLVQDVERRLERAHAVGPSADQDPSQRIADLAREFGLSNRQAQAIAGIAEGLSDAEIAQALQVSYSRTRQLLAVAFAKLGLKSRNDFIRFIWERSR